jgi:hypothetical protein
MQSDRNSTTEKSELAVLADFSKSCGIMPSIMAEQELFREQKPEGQKPKTMAEHRVEFTQRYEHLRIKGLEASWIDEGGEEKIGNIYRISSPNEYNPENANNVSEFVIRARQAGFTIIDKTDYSWVNSTVHQYTLEGKPLSPPT